jgi:hypothetical protein
MGTVLLAGLLGVLAAAPPARGATEAERVEALRDLQEGNRLFDAGDYLGALARFESAYAKVPSSKLFFNLGQVHRRLGRTVEALDFYERYLSETPNAPSKPRAEARQRIGDLEKSVASIEIRADAAGHEVTVDGRSYGVTPLQRAVRVLPGPHQIVVQSGASGATPFVQKIVARAGERIAVDAHVKTPVAVAGPSIISAPVETARSSEPQRSLTASPPDTATAPVSTVSASPPSEDGGGAHRPRFGLGLRADIDRGLAGAGVAGALDCGVLDHLAISAGGFRWPVEGHAVSGLSVGVTAYLLGGAVRPLLAIEGQLYFQSGAHPGAHAAAGVQWDITDHAGLYALAGGQYTSTEIASGERTLFFVPSLGLHLRL